MQHTAGIVSSAIIAGVEVQFFVADENDWIQRCHARGAFYEAEELGIIADFFPRGGVFVDVGANVGNHTLYVCKFLHPLQVIVFEPNPAAIPILRINLALNGVERTVDLSSLGAGLSDAPGKARLELRPGNLGATRMHISNEPNGLPLFRGDDILMRRRTDFIKIDIEGMEMRALNGLTGAISRWRPSIFVEVDDRNVAVFQEWLTVHDYTIMRRYRRYEGNENYMIVPVELSEGIKARA